MTTDFIAGDIWPQLTRAARSSRQRCSVAVAYLGAGASRQLPLRHGSRLVVDASERAVASGQTCPAELIKLMKLGVSVYSVTNLHAKVFVIGRAAFIGSTNVSGRSASHLVEAVIRTTEPKTVRDARQFVHGLCAHELSPILLQRLAKLYRPPIVPGGKAGRKAGMETSRRPTLPRLFLVQLKVTDWSDRDQVLHDAAMGEAKKRRKHPRTHELDSFRWTGACPYKRGDVIIQVTKDGGGKVLVAPPGNVLNIRTRQGRNRRVSFVCMERPSRRQRDVKAVARSLGRGWLKRLRRDGLVRNAACKQALLNAWAR